MSRTKPAGPPGAPGRRPPKADRRPLLLLVGLAVVVVGYYVFQGWREGADRAASRSKLLEEVAGALAAAEPDLDLLGELMAGLTMLEGSSTDVEVLTPRAEIELLRGRAERAYRLYAAVADAPGATAAQQRLGARIQLARQDGFGGDAATAKAMLEQVAGFSERVYQEGGDPADALRTWQACKRMWSHGRAATFAQQLADGHAGSKEQRLVALAGAFDPARDVVAVEDLLIDFGDRAPAELVALQTLVTLQSGDVSGALQQAERALNRFAGVGGVRYVLAIVLHACALGSPAGSLDRGRFVERRDQQLDWLEQRAPADESLRQQWLQMRAVK